MVMSGLPGVGKSAIADAVGRELGAVVLSVDPIEAAMWRCGVRPSFETGVATYEVAAVLAEHQLSLGLSVITDSVSALEIARSRWREAAVSTTADLRIIEVICSDREVHHRRLTSRQRAIYGFPEPSWDDVQRRRAEWEPWTEHRLVVDTIGDHADNVDAVLRFIGR